MIKSGVGVSNIYARFDQKPTCANRDGIGDAGQVSSIPVPVTLCNMKTNLIAFWVFFVCFVLEVSACSGTVTELDAGEGGLSGGKATGSGGATSSRGGSVAEVGGSDVAGGGTAGNDRPSIGGALAVGGRSTSGEPSSGGGNVAGGGSAGASGSAATTTVKGGNLVSVTYTPATDTTVVAVTVDSTCSLFPPPALTTENAICVNVSVAGQTVGVSTVCFASSTPRQRAFRCQQQEMCSFQEYVYRPNEVNYCCEALIPGNNTVSGWDCFAATTLDSFAYGDTRDADQDGRPDLIDNCPYAINPTQRDADFDLIGDNCDNCILVPNQDQLDSNHDGIGDACEGAAGAGDSVAGAGDGGGGP